MAVFWNGKPPHLSVLEVVNAISFLELDKALNLEFLKIEKNSTFVNSVMCAVYQLGPITIFRHWEDSSLYCDPSPPGHWRDTLLNCYGEDIISLKLHLATILPRLRSDLPGGCSPELLQEAAAQFCPTASKQSVIDDLVSRLGIDTSAPKIRQPTAFRGWSQIIGGVMLPSLAACAEEDDTGVWPDCRPDRVPFIGCAHMQFEMRDARGRLQQIIGRWPAVDAPLLLSFTLWQNDQDSRHQRWKLGRSAIRICPYGLPSALENKDASIVIDEDLCTVDRENLQLIKHHASASPFVFVAWPRGLDGALPADTDWTSLRGRKVLITVGNDRTSFVNALALNYELKNAGVGNTEFVLPKGFEIGNNDITIDHKGGDIRGVRKDEIEFLTIAQERFGVSPRSEWISGISNVWTILDRSDWPETCWIMPPYFERCTVNLIYSEPGAGKSWFVLHILYALATGRKLWGKFHAPKRLRCLYLAGETPSKMCQRLRDIHAAAGACDGDVNIEVYPRPGQNIEKLNLEYEEGWKEIEKLVEKADVIAIDHLTAFTSSYNTPDVWSRFHALLRRLTRQGKTILLLHHAGKNGQSRGTSVMDADVDTKIHIKRISVNGSLVEFEKHRDDATMGKALQPFQLYYEKDTKKLPHCWTKDAEAAELQSWVPPPESNVTDISRVDEAFILENFAEKKADIIRCLAVARLRGKPGLRRSEIDSQINTKASTARSLLNDLAVKEAVIVAGKGKATRYSLSEDVAKSIMHK